VTFKSSFTNDVAPSKSSVSNSCRKSEREKSKSQSKGVSVKNETKNKEKGCKCNNQWPWTWVNDMVRVESNLLTERKSSRSECHL
jgi:hypothetical protein